MEQETLIQKWLLEDLSVEESKAFDALEDAPFYKGIIDDAAQFKASNFSKIDDFETFKARLITTDPKVRKLQGIKPMLRIASVAVILFGLSYFFLFSNPTEVQTLAAQKTTIELADASQVVLNALSEISYDENKWDTQREIKLEGEAFFDVAKGAKFDVVTSEGTVSVLGTEFNVKQRGSFFEVACFEGTVRVVTDEHTQILQAGDNFRLFDGEMATGKNSYEEPQWTKNKSYFKRVPVSEVFAELERQYQVSIIFENIDTNQLFTGIFLHDDLNTALMSVSEPLDLHYQILKPNTVRFTGRE
ncbi:FecR family protein [Flagellimonas meridianipacifica]|uniref:Ferric-dicitrate binding protein FerR (Iron transport regulator) n=1 Tax=Flagellimonas meridianipacifica TaxID=1080225 RepID=A0A2T0MCJ8_9FLAO|nr:FecR domain-containing protein [Allomuricauda pacifica]PRX55218.1 ferric-dicitrate binding protein FerR (iron transport regulator) [Allomuricauda pacifica]